MNAARKAWLCTLSLVMLALAPMGVTWAQVKVTAADPASTTQGTVSLDVTISGSGFDSTAKAQFLVAGSTTETGGITVIKNVVQGSKKLIATISVADTALVSKFDIEVTLDSGRKGKGTTLFSVQAKTSDPCTQPGLDFPAFVYWRQNGASTRQLFVADATGTCSRSIMSFVGANGTAFSYPVAGSDNVGRIVFSDGGSIQKRDFIVNVADNSIETGDSTPLFSSLNVGSHELSPDGTTVYFTKGAGSPEGFGSLHRFVIGDQQVPQEIYRSLVAGSALQLPTVSEDGTTIVVEETAYPPESHRLLRITLPCTDAVACTTVLAQQSTTMWVAADATAATAAYTGYIGGLNNCFQLRYIDVAAATPMFEGTQARFGTAPSWLEDNLLVNGRTPPDRKGTCRETGIVTRIDPSTGAEAPLVSGYGPDAR